MKSVTAIDLHELENRFIAGAINRATNGLGADIRMSRRVVVKVVEDPKGYALPEGTGARVWDRIMHRIASSIEHHSSLRSDAVPDALAQDMLLEHQPRCVVAILRAA